VAVALGAEAPASERRDTMLALATATFAAGDIEGARRRYAQAAAAARRDGDAAAMAEAALGFSQVHPYGAVDSEGMMLLTQALERLPAEDGSLRARSMGLLAILEPDQERREALIDDALAMAQRMHDEETLGALYPNQLVVEWRPERTRERAKAAEEVVRLAAKHADHGALVWAYLHRIRDAMQAGDVARADADLDRARSVSRATRRTHHRWFLMVYEAGRAAFAGRLDEAERLNEEALAVNRQHGEDCYQEHTVHRLVLSRLTWRPQDAGAVELRGFAARYPQLPVWEAMVALLEFELGDIEAARRSIATCAHDAFGSVVRSPDFLPAALCLADPVAGAGEPGQVERLYELLLPHATANPVLINLWAIWGPVARGLGMLAAADDRPQDAAAHFADALRLALEWQAQGWALRTIGDWLATGVPVPDRPALANQGLLLARELGLPRVAARIADEAHALAPRRSPGQSITP
jgi:tetratricopeptide (TPR) repeat protein